VHQVIERVICEAFDASTREADDAYTAWLSRLDLVTSDDS